MHLERLAAAVRSTPVSLVPAASYEDVQERTADGMFVCQDCRQVVRALVDDGSLCLRCDLLRYPFDRPTRRAS